MRLRGVFWIGVWAVLTLAPLLVLLIGPMPRHRGFWRELAVALGLAGLLSTFSRWEAIDSLEVYAGGWALNRIQDLLYGVVLRGAKPPMHIELVEIKPGTIFEEGDFRVSAFPVYHRGPDCYGFLFEEKSRRPFLAEQADALPRPLRPAGAPGPGA